MSETKHTPGPWVVEDPIESLTPIGAHGRNGGKWVAHCLGPHQAANARLIAACPTMYAYIAKKAQDGDADATRILAAL